MWFRIKQPITFITNVFTAIKIQVTLIRMRFFFLNKKKLIDFPRIQYILHMICFHLIEIYFANTVLCDFPKLHFFSDFIFTMKLTQEIYMQKHSFFANFSHSRTIGKSKPSMMVWTHIVNGHENANRVSGIFVLSQRQISWKK